jgi:DNA-binding GntR family transcriptional regulator
MNLGEHEIKKMEKLNEKMRAALVKDNFNTYYEENLQFHDVFLRLSGNEMLRKTVDILKRRLYDFPRRIGYVKEWEEASLLEHQHILKLISEGKFLEAANYMRDVHWSFVVQEKFVNMYYAENPEE